MGDDLGRWLMVSDATSELALIEVAGGLQTNGNRSIDVQVQSKLARIVANRRDQDGRYAASVARNAKSKPSEAQKSFAKQAQEAEIAALSKWVR